MTRVRNLHGPVGSDFESLQTGLFDTPRKPPWELHRGATAYVETGRQALAVVADALKWRGYEELVVPGFLCSSMVEPFVRAGWRVRALRVSPDLKIEWDGESGRFGKRTAVLLAAYFGRAPDGTHLAIARAARAGGSVVIEDETHRVFRPGMVPADVTIASLRKLLPVADGAYLQGDPMIVAMANTLAESDSMRWAAMDAKADALRDGSTADFRAMFSKANMPFEEPTRLRRATNRSVETIGRLPFATLAGTRRRNAAALSGHLSSLGVPMIRVDPADVPSHLVIVVPDPSGLQQRLAAKEIYCPIHWPVVTGVDGIGAWRTDLLSVPIDHRYDLQDMARIADQVSRELAA